MLQGQLARRTPQSARSHGRLFRSARRSSPLLLLTTITLLLSMSCASSPAVSTPPWNSADHLANDWGRGNLTAAVTQIAYNPDTSDAVVRADIYLPRAGGNRGVLIYVHGGGFLGGNRAQMLDEAGPLLHQIDRGFAILNIDYRLGAFPNGVPDANAAVQFVRTRASEFGLNAQRIIIGGFSAGGAISANAALSANASPDANDSLSDNGPSQAIFGLPQAVDGWVSIAAPLDFYSRSTPFWSAPTAWSTLDQRASALNHLDPLDPPGLVIQGDSDVIVPPLNAITFQAAARRVGYLGLNLDYVTTGPASCRIHQSACGASVANLDRFFDQVVEHTG